MDNNDNWKLHCIVIDKTIPLENAKQIAAKFTHYKFYRITDYSYRFRHAPKTKFKKFRSKVVNEHITLTYGLLK